MPEPERSLARWGVPGATCLAFGLGHAAARPGSFESFPPTSAIDWLPYLVVLAATGEAGGRGGTLRAQRAWAGGLSLLLAWLLLRPRLHPYGTPAHGAWLPSSLGALGATIGVGLALAAWWAAWEALANAGPRDEAGRADPWRACLAPLAWVLVALSAAAVVGLSGSATLGAQQALALPLVLAALSAALAGSSPLEGASLGLSLGVGGGLCAAFAYAEVPGSSALLLALTPGCALAARWLARARRAKVSLLWVLAASLTPLALSIALAYRASPSLEVFGRAW